MTRARRGMTLLEAILALGLALALVGGMVGFYREIVQARAAMMEQVEAVRARRHVMNRITDELRGALAQGPGVRGSDTGIRFMTAGVPGPAAWLELDATETPPPPEQDLRLVGYRIRYEETEDGDVVAVGLERTEQTLVEALVAEEGREIRAALVSESIKFLRVQYWDGEVWFPSPPEGMPTGVEIALGAEPLPEETDPLDYPYEVVRRVIALPAAQPPARQADVDPEAAGKGGEGGRP